MDTKIPQNYAGTSLKWNELLSGFSLEMPVSKAASLETRLESLPLNSEIYLPHLSGRDSLQLKQACQRIQNLGYIPVPHVGARHFESVTQLTRHLNAARTGGASRLLVLAGERGESNGVFMDSLDIINHPVMSDLGFKHISISGYPEGHANIKSRILNETMAQKLSILADKGFEASITTQFGFDPLSYITWIRELRARGINTKVNIGVAGITSIPSLIKYAVLCGIGPSLSVLKTRFGAVVGLLKNYEPKELLIALMQDPSIQGDMNISIHFFPFGGVQKTLDWIQKQLDQDNV